MIDEQFELTAKDDNFVSFGEPEFKKKGFSISDVERVKDYLVMNGVIARFTDWDGDPNNPLPSRREDKARTFSWWWPLGKKEGKTIRKYVFELASREKFFEFYKQLPTGEKSPMEHTVTKVPVDNKLAFDSDRSVLSFDGREILISKKTDKANAHYVLKYIFENPDGLYAKSNYSEIHGALGDTEKQYSWKLYYRACEDVQEKVRKGTPERIEDFLIFKSGITGWVQINPKYSGER
jgi:hypothetical protein